MAEKQPTPARKNAGRTHKSPDKPTRAAPAAKGTKAAQARADAAAASDEEDLMLDEAQLYEDEEGGTRVGGIYIPPPIAAHCSTESKGPRLIITHIENINFKSYAKSVILGPFHQRFTAIIGPNGSGKSNVIDSMLFVFGYRANKIRCKKLSTLVHNSAKCPNVQSCTVSVHFQQILDKPDGGFEEVPNSTFVVSRTAARDNSSYYALDGKRVQFKDVAKLLKKHNVDLDHNRFLILQGEVESIAMMKPKGATENECGMLEYLEDIIGTSRYKVPLQKIHERLDQLTEERVERHNRCKLALRDVRDLEQPLNEAVQYLRTENEHTRLKNKIHQYSLHICKKELKAAEEAHTAAADKLKEQKETLKTLAKERDEKEKTINQENSEYKKLEKRKQEIASNLEALDKQHKETQHNLVVTNKNRKQKMSDIKDNEAEIVRLERVPDANATEIRDCELQLERLERDKQSHEDTLEGNYIVMKEQTAPHAEKQARLETRLVGLKEEVDKAKSALSSVEADLKLLQAGELAETRKYEVLKSSYEETVQRQPQLRQQIEQLETLLPQIDKEMQQNRQKIQQLVQEEKHMQNQAVKLRTEIDERQSTIQANRSNNKVLDFLMRQKNEGKIPGILGRLGDLGGIDKKYDVAISTACGRLDNIVVDTVDTAQTCIEQMKRFDVGRASFIALEKVERYANYAGAIQTPENAPRLYDLVRVEDERLLAAFYFSLRDTLVANDLDQGTRIAYGAKRFRVVTLQGDVIEMSGTMSGGGRTQIRGKMGTKVQVKTRVSLESSSTSQKDIDEMLRQAEQLQSKINYCQEEQGRLDRELKQLEIKKSQSNAELVQIRVSLRSLEQSQPEILKRLEAQRLRSEATKSDAVKVKALEAERDKLQKQLDTKVSAAKKVEAETAEIEKEIDSIRSRLITSVQKQITNIKNNIQKLQKNINKKQVEIDGSKRQIEKLKEKNEELSKEIENCKQEIVKLSAERENCETKTAELNAESEKLEKDIKNFKSQFAGLQKEIDEIREKETAGKTAQLQLENNAQETLRKVHQYKSKLPGFEANLKSLKLNEIPTGDKELAAFNQKDTSSDEVVGFEAAKPEEPLCTYTPEELDGMSGEIEGLHLEDVTYTEKLKHKPNLTVIAEYKEKYDAYMKRMTSLDEITEKRNEMRKLFDDVRTKRQNEFKLGFATISQKLKEMYQMITQGGAAELEFTDAMDPFTEGITFSVRPPKKTWKNISNLSGGEKTLSSLALVFALHYYKPSPLYFMDEIDAALDFKNISIVAHYIKERTKNAQFIIISLRSNMFELSDHLVGIYKTHDCSASITIQNTQVYEYGKIVEEETMAETQQREALSQITSMEPHDENTENLPPAATSMQIDDTVSMEIDHVEPTMPRTTISVGGISTFAPAIESTALSQDIAVHARPTGGASLGMPNDSATNVQTSNSESTDADMRTVVDAAIAVEQSVNAENSITDVFKKPNPPA